LLTEEKFNWLQHLAQTLCTQQ